jgi:hypothetical protein|tara:strand:+ start:621 stop:791 length:171 start_codon:yes stop_codon:yes gene_type:complete
MKIYKDFPVYGGLPPREYSKTLSKTIKMLEKRGVSERNALKIAKNNTKKTYLLPLA